jgi:co-chaperonin GroES (HSP10)
MNYTFIGDKVLVKLDPVQNVLPSGIINPSLEIYETDGGKIATRTSKGTEFQPQGTVIAISDLATEKLKIISVDDKVRVSSAALNPSFYFSFEPSNPTEGLVLIPHTLIDAKIND